MWSGLYVAGAFVCFVQTSGLDAELPPDRYLRAVLMAASLAIAVYLLDRAKLKDAWLDPADEAAHPRRYRFIAARAPRIRAAVIGLLALSAWLAFGLAPWAALLPLAATGGVLLYAARPRADRPRPKDVLVAKSLFIACGITGFSLLTALAAHPASPAWPGLRSIISAHPAALTLSIALLVPRVFADAVLCDLDDERSDREHGTRTLPGTLGRAASWNFALLIRLALAAALAGVSYLPLATPPFTLRCWAAVTAVSSIALRWWSPARVRDWVDARFAAEAAIVTIALSLRSAL